MTLKSDDAKFEEKLTCGLENDMRNSAKCYQSNWKSQNWKFIEELCIMTMRNDAKFEEESTCRFKTDTIIWRILSSFYLFWPKYIIFELKGTEELCLTPQKIDAKFEGKLTCAFQNDMRNLANFHRRKSSDFILESKLMELNQNKNSKELDRSDAVRLYFTLELNEQHN